MRASNELALRRAMNLNPEAHVAICKSDLNSTDQLIEEKDTATAEDDIAGSVSQQDEKDLRTIAMHLPVKYDMTAPGKVKPRISHYKRLKAAFINGGADAVQAYVDKMKK